MSQMRPDDFTGSPRPVVMSALEGVRKYGGCLSPYEKEEIAKYPKVYYCGQGCSDKINAPTSGPNSGFDTAEGEYIFRPNDHIAYRYEILEELGSGAFGQVLKAIDHTDERLVAVKLIRNQRKVLQQAVQEIKILEHVNERDPNNMYGIVRMIESFSFRGHTCISYELLGTNLYEYLKEKDFYPMALSLIRGIAARMLVALTFLGRENIMHCDLKPENILIRDADPSVVKLVDLGSASFDANNAYMYIQSRFYRAPEVILEQKYSKAIDWWSLGCILCELANGDPVFPGDDEKDQLGCIMEYLGPPPESFIEASSARRKREFFDEHLQPRPRQTRKGRARVPGSKSLAKFLGVPEDDDFLSFVMQFLQWDPSARVSPREAMRHKWIRDEFVFPAEAAEKSVSVSTTNAEASSSSAVAAEADGSAKPTAPLKPVQPRSAWQSKPNVVGGVDIKSPRVARRAVRDSNEHRARSDAQPSDDSHRSPGTASVPAVTNSNEGVARATAQSTGGGPRRPTASQRHNGQAFRGRQRRSTEMTEVEIPGKSSASTSAVVVDGAVEEKTRDFIIAVESGSGPAERSLKSASHDANRGAEKAFAPPTLKPSVLSPSMLSMPVNVAPANAIAGAGGSGAAPAAAPRQYPVRHGGGEATAPAAPPPGRNAAIATTNFPSPSSNKNSASTSPTAEESNSKVLELRRKFETSAAPGPKTDSREHSNESVKGRGVEMTRFAFVGGYSSNDKDPSHGSMSHSAKQRAAQEPEPTTPVRMGNGKVHARRRQEYSLTIERTPTPPPLEPPAPVDRPRALPKAHPPSTAPPPVNRGISLLSSSRPQEPGSSFMYSGKQASPAPAEEETRSSGETVMLSTPQNVSSCPSTTATAAGTPAPRPMRDAIFLQRSTQCNMPVMRDNGSPDIKERRDSGAAAENGKAARLSTSNAMRLMPQRQVLAQRQRQNIVAALGEAKPASPNTVLPPLKKNFVK